MIIIVNIIKKFYEIKNADKKDFQDYIIGSKLLESYKEQNMECMMYCFDKKALFFENKILLGKLKCFSKNILKSQMVVWEYDCTVEKYILDEVKVFCDQHKKYGPIVRVEKNKLIFFPNLKYQDVYLIKEIVKNNFKNKEIDVVFGDVIV